MSNYHPIEIEEKWLKIWEGKDLYRAREPWGRNTPGGKPKADRGGRMPSPGVKGGKEAKLGPKYYALVEFPYPSGDGLHIGHAFTNTVLDVLARQKRMAGFNVLHPMGWDSFGLPTENSAIKYGIHPVELTKRNTRRFHEQNDRLGISYDWNREIDTTDPDYYKWTQWIFIQLFKHGLAYKEETPVGWCPSCKIILANEEIVAGKCERCGHDAEYRRQAQWLLRITAYADRLAEELDQVDYPEYVKKSQRDWIGRSEGVEIEFPVYVTPGGKPKAERGGRMPSPGVGILEPIRVFTTAIDTIFGTTFMVLSPEVAKKYLAIVPGDCQEEVSRYIADSLKKSELERQAEGKAKTGVPLGFDVVNPFSGKPFPVFVADYVLAGYGTGAVMGVPGHDWRDHEFAEKFELPIIPVIKPSDQVAGRATIAEDGYWAYEEVKENAEGAELINSGKYNGKRPSVAKAEMMSELVGKGWGNKKVNYHLRDWVFSRQHYWGEPIPMVYCEACAKKRVSWWETTEGQKFKNSKIQKFKGLGNSSQRLVGWFPVPEEDLPVKLPEVEKYQPTDTGESPLAKMTEWVATKCPECGGPARRETDTMPNWAGSSWYYLAFCFAEKLRNSKSQAPNSKQNQNTNDQIEAQDTPGAKLEAERGGRMPSPGVEKSKLREMAFQNIFEENKNVLDYWLPVDLYMGGAEHTTLHLLYSRFWHKFLNDIGVVPGKEPYAARRQHGVILGEDGSRMSKSRGNVINPEEAVAKFGADALRVYLMFMGPYEATMPWSTKGLEGAYRFLSRVWRLVEGELETSSHHRILTLGVAGRNGSGGHDSPGVDSANLTRSLHKTIKKVTEDIGQLKHNTAIAALMELVNEWSLRQAQGKLLRQAQKNTPGVTDRSVNGGHDSPGVDGKMAGLLPELSAFVRLLAPFAPFVAEELFSKLYPDHYMLEANFSVHSQVWPEFDSELVKEEVVTVIVQINGKTRGQVELASDQANEQSIVDEAARKEPNVAKHLEGKSVKKVIFVPGRLINCVV